MRDDIKAAVNALKVPYLLHFTRASNLPSIMKHGLQPVGAFANLGIKAEINDQLRLDGRLNGTSLSIAHPNGKMFYRLRKENPAVDWVVLSLHPNILWTKPVLFCKHNAAASEVSRATEEQLSSLNAFNDMFAEIEGLATRQAQSLRDFDPTDVQAEVLVMDPIESGLIKGVAFMSATSRERFAADIGDRQAIISAANKGVFAERTYRRRFSV